MSQDSDETRAMRRYRDRAVVLRQHKLGEADRIVTLLTRDHGLVRAVAKGVRRTRSGFGSRLEPFAHIDVQLHPGRNLDIVTQGGLHRRLRHRHRQRLRALDLRLRGPETAERLAGEEHARPGTALAHGRGTAGGGRQASPRTGAGRLPGCAPWASPGGRRPTECARCAAPGPHRAFHIAAGGSVCMHCRPSGSTAAAGGRGPDVGAARRRLGAWRPPRRPHPATPAAWAAAHLQWHLERQLRTLPLVERVYRQPIRPR